MKQPGDYALRQAERAAKRGDLAAAERWTKIATQNQKLWAQFQARPAALTTTEEELELRAELARRMARFAAYDADVDRWRGERDRYIAHVKEGGEPPPLRAHPAGAPEDEHAHYVHLLQGAEPED